MAFIEDFSWIKDLKDRETRNEPEYVERVADALASEEIVVDPVDPATVMPSDQEEDAYGQMKYLQDANGAWYNNSEFYTPPVKPADADSAPPDANGNYKYYTTTDSRGNTVWNINPDYNSGRKPGTKPPTGIDADGLPKDDAFAVVDDLVRSYGLDQSVADFIKGEMTTGQSRTAIAMKIRELPAYNLRFPAMKARIDAGLPALT
ncbi:MAG: hypothetical protein CMA06_03495, partial [Euryarchaeota archaeon]|nr:hypothetical protein [Euryarchaeota archaeon]